MSWFGVWATSSQQAREVMKQLIADESPQAYRLLWTDEERLGVALYGEVHRDQQVFGESGDSWVVGEARFDDHAELSAVLGVDRATTPGSLSARAWSRWGPQCGQHLRGDIALCAWNAQSRTLSLLRDAIGVKPLYYTTLDRALVWASDFSRLTQLKALSHALDPRMVVDYLGELPEDENRTLLEAIRRLPPACCLVQTASRVLRVERYYTFAPRTPDFDRDDAYADELRELLTRATESRLAEHGQTGVLLSGGLDSSMVATLASHASRAANLGPIATFSATFDAFPDCNERPFQSAVVAVCQSEHQEFSPVSRDASGDLVDLFRTFGQPRPIGAHWLAWAALTHAAARGVRVVLTGIDGDRVVSHGEAHLTELARAHQYAGLLRECWGYDHRSTLGRARLFAYQVGLGLLPMPWLHRLDDHRNSRTPEARVVRRFVRPSALTASSALERHNVQSRRPASPYQAHARRIAATDRAADLELLAALEPRFGVRLAHPFYDQRVIEFCLGLPSRQRKRGKRGRFVLREAMRGLVPDVVRLRQDKAYFDDPFRAWARDWLMRRGSIALLPRHTPLAEFVHVDRICAEAEAILAGRENGPALDFLWRTVILSLWFEGLARGTHVARPT